jgi:ABC-2 type transport system permease protein
MRGFIAFTKKEFSEQLRGYKAIILTVVLFFFGMMSPLLAKLLPELLGSMDIQGITLTIPAATSLDAYAQFFKNVGQLGFLALLLVFGGLLSQDVTKGTLVVLLAKGLSRPAVIFSKFIAALVVWTVGYALAAGVAYGYTVYLFESGALPYLFYALFLLWLFGAFLLALLVFASTLAPGSYGGLLLTAAVLVALLILGSFPAAADWNPITLASKNSALLTGAAAPADVSAAVWTTLGYIAALLAAAVLVFRKKRL